MASVPIVFRPLVAWPGAFTPMRKASPFQAPWSSTTDLLDRELFQLRARDVVIQLAMEERDIRRDGLPRSNARASHPGVVLAFNSRFGPLQYQTDTFIDWQSNVRAIALALEALRKVDRYGVSKRGEQYTGWRALPSSAASLVSRGKELIARHGGVREALHATHPDHGGNADDFHAVQAARSV